MRDVFGLPVVVAINKHKDDKAQELGQVEKCLIEEKTPYAVATPFEKGGNGCKDLAVLVEKICSQKKDFCYVWDWKDDIKTRVEKIATKIYGAKTVKFSPLAKRKLEEAEKHPDYFVNIAKTQSSLSDDKNLLGAPSGFDFHISDLQIRHGAKMIVFVAGDMFLMPGLGKNSNYQNMKIDKNGKNNGDKIKSRALVCFYIIICTPSLITSKWKPPSNAFSPSIFITASGGVSRSNEGKFKFDKVFPCLSSYSSQKH